MAKRIRLGASAHLAPVLIVVSIIGASPARAQTAGSSAEAPSPSSASAAPAAVPARSRVPLTRETATERRTNFEQGWPLVEANLKRWQNLTESPRDFRSVSPSYDFKNYVFTKDDRKALETRRDEAQRQFDGGDWPGAILLYGMLIDQANGVVVRLTDVGRYWLWYFNHDRRKVRWRKTVRLNDLANPAGPELEAIESRLEEQIRAKEFGAPSKALMRDLDRLFKEAGDNARAAAPGGVLRYDPLRRTPENPCADGPPDMPGKPGAVAKSAPKFDARRSKSSDNYYPQVARYSGIQGVVTLRTLISPSGCVVYAEVAQTSGSDLLDDAAMDWAVEAAVFNPALDIEQKPMPATVEFRVRFRFTD